MRVNKTVKWFLEECTGPMTIRELTDYLLLSQVLFVYPPEEVRRQLLKNKVPVQVVANAVEEAFYKR